MLQDWVGGKACWLYFWNTSSTRSGECWRWIESLSRLPRDVHTYMDSCTKKLFPESLHASISAVQTLSHGDLMWLTTLTDDDALSLVSCNRVRVVNLIKAQKEDPHIGRVLDYSKQTANRQKRKRTKNQLWFVSSWTSGASFMYIIEVRLSPKGEHRFSFVDRS